MIRTNYAAPDTLTRADQWRKQSACRTEDAELFFPTGHDGAANLAQIAEAKAVCARCPVAAACLNHALDHHIGDGIFGGLTEKERGNILRTARRNNLPVDQVADEARQPPKRTLQTIFDANKVPLHGGHLGWQGALKTGFGGRFYTAKQIAFVVDRGRMPDGPVKAGCSREGCILPAHLSDLAERGYCGTRGGYQRHRAAGEEACPACRQANAKADARLRRTGTSRVLT